MKSQRRSSMPTVLFIWVTFLATGLAAAGAHGQSISGSFTRVSSAESLVVPFTSPSVSTVNVYGGTVEVIVSGTGNSYGALVNDAFYGVPSGIPVDYPGFGSLFETRYYQLNIGWSNGFNLVGCDGEPNNINNFITFIDGVGPVTPPAMPAYDPVDHTYHFVVSVPAQAGQVNFGVSDCIFDDNGGQYNIQVFQLAPPGAPTPTVTLPPTSTPVPTTTSTSMPTQTPTTTMTATPTWTPNRACAVAPRSGCQQPQRASGISLNAAAHTVSWTWLGGSTRVALPQLGDPVNGSTGYHLCVYDTSAGPPSLAFSATVPAGAGCGSQPCWRHTRNRFSYNNNAATPDGVTHMTLQASGGTGASIVVRGSGRNLRMPTSADGIFLLREFPEVIVQVQRSDASDCWEAVFTGRPIYDTRWVFVDTIH